MSLPGHDLFKTGNIAAIISSSILENKHALIGDCYYVNVWRSSIHYVTVSKETD